MEESRLQASHMLQSSLQSNGDRRYATPPQQIAAHNRKAIAQYKDNVPRVYAITKSKLEVVYGEDVSIDFLVNNFFKWSYFIFFFISDFQYSSRSGL